MSGLGICFFPSVAQNPVNPANSMYSLYATTYAEKIIVAVVQAFVLFKLTTVSEGMRAA
jgi:hypothetical protein